MALARAAAWRRRVRGEAVQDRDEGETEDNLSMTMLAGYLLPDRVLIAADSQISVNGPNGPHPVSDEAIKLCRVGPHSLIGFSGNTTMVVRLWGELFRQLKTRDRADIVSLSRWLPRFFRMTYKALRYSKEGLNTVDFLLAGTVPGRPAQMNVSAMHRTLQRTSSREMSNWHLLRLLKDAPHVAAAAISSQGSSDARKFEIPASSFGRLYSMRSLHFAITEHGPFEYVVLGSGADASSIVDLYRPLIENGSLSESWFMDALFSYLRGRPAIGVGGMVIGAELSRGAVRFLGLSHEVDGRPHPLQSTVDQHGIIVQEPSGRALRLRWPMELLGLPLAGRPLFQAIRHLPRSGALEWLRSDQPVKRDLRP